MNRVFAADQLWYFAEVGAHDSLALGLRHVDYALSRVYWKGDDLLFRPILFIWLASRTASSPTITSGGTSRTSRSMWALRSRCCGCFSRSSLRCWRSRRRLFLVLEPPMELVVWNHLGGYMLACLFLAAGLRSFVRADGRLRGVVCRVCRGCVHAGRAFVRGDGADCCSGCAPPHRVAARVEQARVPGPPAAPGRHLFRPLRLPCAARGTASVRRPRGRPGPFDIANVGTCSAASGACSRPGPASSSMPSALRLSSAPFERFGKAYTTPGPIPCSSSTRPLSLPASSFSALRLTGRLSQVAPLVVVARHRDSRLRVRHCLRTVGRRGRGDYLLLVCVQRAGRAARLCAHRLQPASRLGIVAAGAVRCAGLRPFMGSAPSPTRETSGGSIVILRSS